MTSQKEDRLDRLEKIVADYIEESQADRREAVADRRELRRITTALSKATDQLIALQLQYYRDSISPAPAPSAGD